MKWKSCCLLNTIVLNVLWPTKMVKCDIVGDYVDLINTEVAKTKYFKDPVNAQEFKPKSTEIKNYGNFDYIVIGAGSAGAVIASRLSENQKLSVLLIEAGKNETNFTDIPAMSSYLIATDYNWAFKTTPQNTTCLGMRNRQCAYARGKGLGGSTIMNKLNYIRGNRHDYDDWCSRLGNPGWCYKDVLPFFKKSEGAHFEADPYYHNFTGPLSVELLYPDGRQYEAFIEANLEKGRHIVDQNTENQVGVGKTQFNTLHGRRCSTQKAFIQPAANRRNLVIVTGAYATKIDIRKQDSKNVAYGVTFSMNRTLYQAKAKKEIIVSAGTFQSAQLLLLSGIGKPEDLEPHGIKSIQKYAKVGHNYIEHNSYTGLIFKTNATEPPESPEEYVRQYLDATGPLTFAVTAKSSSWFRTSLELVADWPDIEVLLIATNNSGEILQRFINYDDETCDALYSHNDPTNCFSISLVLMRPKSRGHVSLQSSSAYDYPLIDTNMYTDPENKDLETMLLGIDIILDLINTEAFRKINATLISDRSPKCRHLPINSRKSRICELRHLTYPLHHAVGTCRMGPKPFEGDVVNHRLQVYGVKGLRVADCSIFPTEITGHTNAPAIMVGEKAAVMILEDA